MTAPTTLTESFRVRAAIQEISAGRPIVVVDDGTSAESEGSLVFAANLATPKLVAFILRHTSGFLCAALTAESCERLGLVPMHPGAQDPLRAAHQVTVDMNGTGTGISASARAATIAGLGSPEARATDFVRPGHVVPLRAHTGGVLARAGRPEAALDLARLAGLPAAGALCDIVSSDRPGQMARSSELREFADAHDLPLLSVPELVAFRRQAEDQVRRVVETPLPTMYGNFVSVGYHSTLDAADHIALIAGPMDSDVPVHVHAECATGDIFASRACPCHQRLERAMIRFGREHRGVVVYLRSGGRLRDCSLHGLRPLIHAETAVVNSILKDLHLHFLEMPDASQEAVAVGGS
ncbi:MAG: bifunctional 3,4-dihydroxy-2-butanone-4-phosphate synthase/GTP cyclohydrolase II [Pseudonocardiaceae bacterium]|nr:MAG: bifunctional 3,4-dihydroxy-2-butanone-4-phosphate synthase/GTP cyclohydrolase II [Pseudonocardiaceae bacterium]